MLRVLALRRQVLGSAKDLLDALVIPLEAEDIELVVDDASDWIPNATGFMADKETTKAVKRAAQGFDVVHAWGYRAAWACSEAFYLRSPWLYTAYDIPKTTRPELIDRLNASHRGCCSNHAVRSALEAVDTLNLETIVPGVPIGPSDNPDLSREEARQKLGVRDDIQLVVALGSFVPERGFQDLVAAFDVVREHLPDSKLFLSGAGPEPPPIHQEGIEVRGRMSSIWPALCAADLVVVPSTNAGFSLLGAQAMWAGIPVLYRRFGGLVDMADEGINAYYFEDTEDLSKKIVDILDTELTRESVARSGQLRSQARFKFERYVREMAHVYREIAGA